MELIRIIKDSYVMQNINCITYHNYGEQSWKCFEVQNNSTSTNWCKINRREKLKAIYLITVDCIIAQHNDAGTNEVVSIV